MPVSVCDGIQGGDKAHMGLSTFHYHCLLDAGGNPVKRRVALFLNFSYSPAPFFVSILLPLLVAHFGYFDGFIKHLI